ncbi:hypothetical protein PV08_03775 [Exophiala spinifera]|uniref:Uncharacterized protein n=1 Tax=Exophiala spinifera TaxID=91928 RepID=A0A0D1ZV44_9EURO|nr:uncharacterized protein PV08_03775 [Exophiala spinifera]KIW16587.1 hypothetical protein PV08_03775 [Exophiala spinifera]
MSIGFGDALAVVEKAIAVYQKMTDAVQTVQFMGIRLEGIRDQIKIAQKLVPDDRTNNFLQKLDGELYEMIRKTIAKIQVDAQATQDILEEWYSRKTGFLNSTWRSQLFANMVNGILKGKGDDLKMLNQRLDHYQTSLNHFIGMVNTYGIKELIERDTKNKGKQLAVGTTASANTPASKVGRSSPSPARRKQYRVIFVDPHNEGRSVVAQSYLYLVHQWTVRTDNHWPLSKWESAGMRLRARSAFVPQLQALGLPKRIKFVDGNVPSSPHAVNALFDQPYFNYAYKEPIRQRAAKRLSRGLPANMFEHYDFILVFTKEQLEILEALREHVARTQPQYKDVNQRARILLLGSYSKAGQIYVPGATDDAEELKKMWGKVVNQIKGSVKGFLEVECGWKPPKKDDAWKQAVEKT